MENISPEMPVKNAAWYCARTKQKHEHIAAANLQRNLGLEVFHPRLRVERVTRRGVMQLVEPLFPGYVFVRCVLAESQNDIQHTSGVSYLVQFGGIISTVPDQTVDELAECFANAEPLTVENSLAPGDTVTLEEGALTETRAFVLRVMPARKRVQVLLEILGRPTPVEVDRSSVTREKSIAEMAPVLAAPCLPGGPQLAWI